MNEIYVPQLEKPVPKVTAEQILNKVNDLMNDPPREQLCVSDLETHASWYDALEFIKGYIETGEDPC
jgi:hypothetical protein